MRAIQAIIIAFSTYSALPILQVEWTEDNMRYSICALPLVGLLIGGGLLFWDWLCRMLSIGPFLFAAVAASLPLLITGGIHMDGFCDTVDALSSRQPQEKKLAILKDPHIGAFAIFYCVVYLLIYAGLYAELYTHTAISNRMYAAALVFVLSRCFGALSGISIKNARREGMLIAFTQHVQKRSAQWLLAVPLMIASLGMLLLSPFAGGVAILFGGVGYVWYRVIAIRQFGGVTGDTTGFFIQMQELLMLLGILVGNFLERMV